METKTATKLEPLDGQLLHKYDALQKVLSDCKAASKAAQQQNLYEHVIEVMNMLVVHYPNDALNKLEEVSYLVKTGDSSRLEEFLRVNAKKNYAVPSDKPTAKATNLAINHARALLGASEGAQNEDEEETSGPAVGNVPDLLVDNKQVF